MAAALRAAEGGIFFQNPQGGIFKIFPVRGGVYRLPPIPDPWLKGGFNAFLPKLEGSTYKGCFPIESMA